MSRMVNVWPYNGKWLMLLQLQSRPIKRAHTLSTQRLKVCIFNLQAEFLRYQLLIFCGFALFLNSVRDRVITRRLVVVENIPVPAERLDG